MVTRMCGGRFSIARRSCIRVSPVRTAVRISGIEQTALAGHLQNFGQRDFEVLLDVVAERLQRRDVQHFGAILQFSGKRLADQSIDAGQKAASVLPDPVGAEIRVVRPARMCGQPCSCGSVGVPKRWTNHSCNKGCAHASDWGTGRDILLF